MEILKGKQKPQVDYELRQAREDDDFDAEGIANVYNSAYVGYPFPAFTQAERVKSEVIPNGNDTLVVEVAGGQEVNGTEVTEDTIVGTGSVKYHRDGHEAEFGGIVLHPDFQESEASFYDDLVSTRVQEARDSEAERYFTDAISSRHAKTQHGHAKKGAVPEGVSLSKYPQIFADEGRETVVPMLYPDGNFQYTGDNSRTVYTTGENEELVKTVRDNLNQARSDMDAEELSRRLSDDPVDAGDTGYRVEQKAYDDETAEMASFRILNGGDLSLDEALSELDPDVEDPDEAYSIEQALEDDSIRWVGVEFDANHRSAQEVADKLSDRDFVPERYSPEAINYGDDVSDAMGYQFFKDGTDEIQLIDPAEDTLAATGIDYEDGGQGPVEGVKKVAVN